MFASVLSAQELNPLYTNNSSQPIWGPPIDFSTLKGKVVFIEYWGVTCGPCKAAFPKLIDCNTRYAPTGKFVMIGSHVWEMSEKIVPLLRDKKCNFTNYQEYVCPLPDARPGGGVPRSILIDHTGKVVEVGHPLKVLPKVESYVMEAKYLPLGVFRPSQFSPCGGLELGEGFQGLPKHFLPDKPWGPALKKLAQMGKPKGKDPGNAEAQELYERIMAAIEGRVEEILAIREDRPVHAMVQLTQMNKNVAGLPVGVQVREALQELRKDKEVMDFQKLWNEAVKMLQAKVDGIPPKKFSAARKGAGNVYQKLKKLCESDECSPAVVAEAKSLMKLLKSEFTQESSSPASSLSSVEL